MLRMTPQEIASVTGAALVHDGGRAVCGAAAVDSRQVEKDGLFVAFRGERVDGNAYLAVAARSGAAAVIATSEPGPEALEAARASGCSVLRAAGDDGEEFLLRLARAWRERHPEWVVLAVTGSVGKTTTKEMLAAAVGSQRRCFATRGNLNSLIGLPLTLLSAPDDAEVLVLELGMNHPGEIARMSRACQPTLACLTNVGTSHIGLLGSRENIARTKAEIVCGMRAHGELSPALALMATGDFTPLVSEEYARPAGVDVMLCGPDASADVRLASVALNEEACCDVELSCSDGWSGSVSLKTPGRAAAEDLVLALALAWRLGLDRALALEAVAELRPTSMRLNVTAASSGARVIDDSYNAAPASMAAALDVLGQMSCERRRVAVLGEMGELGDEGPRLHGYVGAYAASKRLAMLVLVGGPLADEMAEAARTMGFSEDCLHRFATADDAARALAPTFEEGDVVLVKGSRSVGLDRFAQEVLAR